MYERDSMSVMWAQHGSVEDSRTSSLSRELVRTSRSRPCTGGSLPTVGMRVHAGRSRFAQSTRDAGARANSIAFEPHGTVRSGGAWACLAGRRPRDQIDQSGATVFAYNARTCCALFAESGSNLSGLPFRDISCTTVRNGTV